MRGIRGCQLSSVDLGSSQNQASGTGHVLVAVVHEGLVIVHAWPAVGHRGHPRPLHLGVHLVLVELCIPDREVLLCTVLVVREDEVRHNRGDGEQREARAEGDHSRHRGELPGTARDTELELDAVALGDGACVRVGRIIKDLVEIEAGREGLQVTKAVTKVRDREGAAAEGIGPASRKSCQADRTSRPGYTPPCPH